MVAFARDQTTSERCSVTSTCFARSPGRKLGSTTTDTGLRVCREIDANLYPKGIQVSEQEMQAINIARDEFHGEWNYTISPN